VHKATIAIFEGPDAAGKSTRAIERQQFDMLHSRRRTHMVHNGPPGLGTTSRQLFDEYAGQLEFAVWERALGTSTVIDRSFVSEIIYGPLFRGHSLLTPRQLRKLERYCDKHDIIRIAVNAPLATRLNRLDERGETYSAVDQHDLGTMYAAYFRAHTAWTTAGALLPATS